MKIICEVGSNWKSKEDCLNAIHLAKAVGADAVKFQMFNYPELYGLEPAFVDQPYELPSTWLGALKAKADHEGIELMCTAFSPIGYEQVNQYVNIHKVASAECTHTRILEKLLGFGKQVVLSTGAHAPADIENSVSILRAREDNLSPGAGCPVILMYCVAAYPAQEIDFRQMVRMQEIFGLPVGFSDHSTDILNIPRLAKAQGAVVLEKHFNPFYYTDTPDAPHSLNLEQFKKMVQNLNGKLPFTWGTGEENEMRLKHNRRLIATRDIAEGSYFVEGENFGIYRSLQRDESGASPFMVNQTIGRKATRSIKAGEAIAPNDFHSGSVIGINR